MKPRAVDGSMRRHAVPLADRSAIFKRDVARQRRGRLAFSLAEMMIALGILALGLLVIGAALPIGARYTRDTVAQADGQAAAEYALDLLDGSLFLRRAIESPNPQPGQPRLFKPAVLFQPRDEFAGSDTGVVDPVYEPLIKVWPLQVQQIDARPGSMTFGEESFVPRTYTGGQNPVTQVQQVARRWLLEFLNQLDQKECDFKRSAPDVWVYPALPSVATVYPPVTPDDWYFPEQYLPSSGNPYQRHPVRTPDLQGSESLKAIQRGIVWNAFYRRVSYAPGSDPSLYELIVVVQHRATASHRFPMQNIPGGGGGNAPPGGYAMAGAGELAAANALGGASGVDTAAPIPWLVVFETLATPPGGFDSLQNGLPLSSNGKPLSDPNAIVPASMTFTCKLEQSGLFPVGGIFIPARNDFVPTTAEMTANYYVGFGPPAPTVLPIYEVIERPDLTTVVCKYNGYYPRMGQPGVTAIGTPSPLQWPVWVVPSAYEENLTSGEPVMPDESTIVTVERRFVHLPTVD